MDVATKPQHQSTLVSVYFATIVCMLAVSMVAGVVIDRTGRRRMILLAHGVAVLAEAATLVLLLDRRGFGHLVMSAIAASIAFPFIMPPAPPCGWMRWASHRW